MNESAKAFAILWQERSAGTYAFARAMAIGGSAAASEIQRGAAFDSATARLHLTILLFDLDVIARDACDFPHLYDRGTCCGETPCNLEIYWPCEAEGGCPDRSTCSPPWGCQDIRPKAPKPAEPDDAKS